MICIQRNKLKVKNLDSVKKIVNNYKKSVTSGYTINHQSFPLDDNFIMASIGLEKEIIIPSSLFNSIGYCYDVTRRFMIFKDQDGLKRFLNNRIKSLRIV